MKMDRYHQQTSTPTLMIKTTKHNFPSILLYGCVFILSAGPCIANNSLANKAIAHINKTDTTSAKQQFHHDGVLGTSLTLTLPAGDGEAKVQARAIEQSVLGEIKRLEKIFSHYDSQSEISQLNRSGLGMHNTLSPDLKALLQACEHWQKAMPEGFSCKMGNVIEAWQQAEATQTRPKRKEFRTLARRALESDFHLQHLVNGEKNDDFLWHISGIAKGYILDKTLAFIINQYPELEMIAIDIGGDGVYFNHTQKPTDPWLVTLAKPHNIDDSANNNLGSVRLNNQAIAYSGHNSRGFNIAQRQYSHILAPRDGWPTGQALTAIVKAPTATEADAIATGLAAMNLTDALDCLDQHSNIDALLISDDGRHHASKHWYNNFVARRSADHNPIQATIKFSLPDITTEQYRRPYLAVWITDENKQVIKNLLLLGDNERWMSKNRYWWRRQGRREKKVLVNLARPTRRAGTYQLSWNGRDDFGQPLPAGDYSLWMEAAREHGDHERIVIPFSLSPPSKLLNSENKLELEAQGIKEIKQLKLKITQQQQPTSLP